MSATARGEAARQEIVNEAMRIASIDGLEGLSLGALAKQLHRSKSGLFAHFGSKEELQIAVLDAAAQKMADEVVRPILSRPRGLPRVRALFEAWARWAWPEEGAAAPAGRSGLPGGCLFVAAATELDDRPGPVRDALVARQQLWLQTIKRSFAICVEEGHLRADADPGQLAFETYSLMLGTYHYRRLLDDREAIARARRAFERLLDDAGASPR